MHCPVCQHNNTQVYSTRLVKDGAEVRRRRKCLRCDFRFTTTERSEPVGWKVTKKAGHAQAYDREKLVKSVQGACRKRPVTLSQINSLAKKVQGMAFKPPRMELTSQELGELVLQELRELDEVAWLRYASILRGFGSMEAYEEAVREIIEERE